jgi:hypothetical protein
MSSSKNYLKLFSIIFILISLNFGCIKKAERRLIGDWEVINSNLYLKSSNTLIHSSEKLGEMNLLKTKNDIDNQYLNEGSWNFENFPDSIIPALGSLYWSSNDKESYVKVPWKIDIIFSTEFKNAVPTQINGYYDCYQGNFSVTELKKKKHYKIEGDISKPQTDPNKPENPYYIWVFELKAK